RCFCPPEHFFTVEPAMSAMPARSRTRSTSREESKIAEVYSTVSATVRSSRRPPVCMTEDTSPRPTDCLGGMPKTSTAPALGRAGESQQHVDGCGLAGAVGPEEGHDLAGADTQVDVIDGPELAEALGQVVESDGVRNNRVVGPRRGGRACCLCAHGMRLSTRE